MKLIYSTTSHFIYNTKAKIPNVHYANVNGMSFLLLICDGLSKFLVNSTAFAFAPIGIGTDSFVAFTFTPMEAS